MPAANDRLIGVVSVEVEAAPRKDAGKNVASGGDALTVFATNADCEIYFSAMLPYGHLSNVLLLGGVNLGKRKHRKISVETIAS